MFGQLGAAPTSTQVAIDQLRQQWSTDLVSYPVADAGALIKETVTGLAKIQTSLRPLIEGSLVDAIAGGPVRDQAESIFMQVARDVERVVVVSSELQAARRAGQKTAHLVDLRTVVLGTLQNAEAYKVGIEALNVSHRSFLAELADAAKRVWESLFGAVVWLLEFVVRAAVRLLAAALAIIRGILPKLPWWVNGLGVAVILGTGYYVYRRANRRGVSGLGALRKETRDFAGLAGGAGVAGAAVGVWLASGTRAGLLSGAERVTRTILGGAVGGILGGLVVKEIR